VNDAAGEETLEIHHAEGFAKPERLGKLDIGRVIDLRANPQGDQVALSNHRNELMFVDLKSRKSRLLDKSDWAQIAGFDWSPDGRWIAYSCALSQHTSAIRVCEVKTGRYTRSRSPCCRMSRRRSIPTADFSTFFRIGIRSRVRQPPLRSRFPPGREAVFGDVAKGHSIAVHSCAEPAEEKKTGRSKADAKKKPVVKIDFDGIEGEYWRFPCRMPLPQIAGIRGKVLFTSVPVEGALGGQNWPPSPEPSAKATLEAYDFESQKAETLVTGISYFELSSDRKTLVLSRGQAAARIEGRRKV